MPRFRGERGGQAPKPRSGAPKAQGLRATLGRNIMIVPSSVVAPQPTVPAPIWLEFPPP